MKKYTHIILKVILSLLIITPILGALHIFPAPTAEMYSNAAAFAFISAMMNSYIVYGIAITCLLTLIALWSGRVLLAMLLLLPVTMNIIGFHATLDGGLLTGGAMMGNVLFIINMYLLAAERAKLVTLFSK